MTHIGLFEGIGGFSLAARWMGWNTLAYCEINPFCLKILKHQFPNARAHEDIRTTDFNVYRGQCDVLTGGFPCQDISIAGNGKGIYGIKSGLWSQYSRAIEEISPKYVIIENSPQLLRKGFEKILYDLSEIGYDAEWECISASEFGFPHERKRLWIIAYPFIQGRRGFLHMLKGFNIEKNSKQRQNKKANSLDTQGNHFLRFEQSSGQPAVFGVDDGLPNRLDVVKRLGAIGNSIVPHIAYEIFKSI